MVEPSVRSVLADVARLDGFFAPATETPAAAGWRPVRTLLTDPAALRRRVGFVAGRLSPEPVEPRVAASVDLLGVAARLVSPSLGAAALGGIVPVLDPDVVWWRDAAPFEAGLPDRSALTGVAVGSAGAAAGALVRHLVEPVLVPLVQAYVDACGLARGLVLGNLASAFAGAATVLGASGQPLQMAPVAIVRELVTRGPLAGAGRYGGPAFVRHSCCLWYRLPGGSMCGDCALLHRASGRPSRTVS